MSTKVSACYIVLNMHMSTAVSFKLMVIRRISNFKLTKKLVALVADLKLITRKNAKFSNTRRDQANLII